MIKYCIIFKHLACVGVCMFWLHAGYTLWICAIKVGNGFRVNGKKKRSTNTTDSPRKKKHDRRMSSKKAWPKTLTIISVWLIKHTNSTIKVRLMQNLCLTNLNIFQNQNQHFTNAKVVEAYLATNKLH